MEEKIVYITSKEDLKESIREVLTERNYTEPEPEFAKERLTRTEAAKLVGVSLPTFAKLVKVGKFREHGFNRKKFYLKSEIIAALTKEAEKK